ncbi:MAG: carboxypeptidase regulatory-like domain-containing protein [Acidobacteria bacterium]|nr:carboxypeptidase regulatory-like domain-containing protein [Acidobacteriota bacterium]
MKRICLAISMAVLAAVPAQAQQGRGTISGAVTDRTGAAVPEAAITIVNTATNAAFPTVTNETGFYSVPALPVGVYTVALEKQGFKKEVRSGLTLQVDQHANINFQLQVGATAESVEVRGGGRFCGYLERHDRESGGEQAHHRFAAQRPERARTGAAHAGREIAGRLRAR